MATADEIRDALLAEQAATQRAADALKAAQDLLNSEMRSSDEQIKRMYGNG